MRRITPLLLALVLAVGVAACGKDGKKAKATTTTTKATTTTVAPSSTTAPCNFAGTTAAQRRDATTPATQPFLLTAVRIAAAGCTDTVTFDFRPAGPAAEPPYALEYRSPPFAQAGSGAPVTVPGNAFLVIRFQPAWIADIDAPGSPPTYTGPQQITASGTSYVRGMALFDAYEGVVGWIIGLDGQRPVRVDETASPARLVINVGP